MNLLKDILDSSGSQSAQTIYLCVHIKHISKLKAMETFENSRKKQHLREVLLHYHFLKKSAAESHRLLVECYGEHALSERQCLEWIRRFKSGDYDIRDKERPGQKRKFKDEELEKLLDEDPYRTQEDLATALNVSQQAVSRRLKALGMVQTDEKK